jgi:hypothetical protein
MPAEAPNGARRKSGEAKPAERAPAIEARKRNTNESLQAAVGMIAPVLPPAAAR